jgi:hypothetical protein
MTDAALLRAAATASGLSPEAFVAEVLGLGPRMAQYLLRGERSLGATARRVCRAVARDPAVAHALTAP